MLEIFSEKHRSIPPQIFHSLISYCFENIIFHLIVVQENGDDNHVTIKYTNASNCNPVKEKK